MKDDLVGFIETERNGVIILNNTEINYFFVNEVAALWPRPSNR